MSDPSATPNPTAADGDHTDAQDIVASFAAPDRFGVVFDRHYPAIRGYLRRRVAPAIADELAAETFVKAFEKRSRYDQQYEDARPWLYAIATNLLRREHRQESRELRARARAAAEAHDNHSGGGVEREIQGPLAHAIRSLARGDRDVLFLFACADLSYDEIARALDIPVGTVRSRLARARSKVREHLGDPRS